MEAAGITLFLLVFLALPIAGVVFWIVKLVEVAKLPELQFRAAGTEKVTWLLVVGLGQIIGALVWHFAKRREVSEAAGRVPIPPPGWYPDPVAGGMRWWDGVAWSGHRHVPPPP